MSDLMVLRENMHKTNSDGSITHLLLLHICTSKDTGPNVVGSLSLLPMNMVNGLILPASFFRQK